MLEETCEAWRHQGKKQSGKIKKGNGWSGPVTHVFNPSTQQQGQADLYEFDTSLVYTASSPKGSDHLKHLSNTSVFIPPPLSPLGFLHHSQRPPNMRLIHLEPSAVNPQIVVRSQICRQDGCGGKACCSVWTISRQTCIPPDTHHLSGFSGDSRVI